jgi:hypothetical protein
MSKTRLSKTRRILLTLSLLCGTIAIAHAGWKTDAYVSGGPHYSNGALGSVRASTDSTQYIGCTTYFSNTGYCYSVSASGTYRSCYWNNAIISEVVATMRSYSYVEFDWDDSGNCTAVSVGNDSIYRPMIP